MTKFHLSGLRALSLLLAGASLLGISGCNPTGKGAGPIRMVINAPNGAANADTGTAFVCLRSGLTATLFFDNGAALDATARKVNWTSSDESVLKVTNYDSDPLPGVANPVKGTTDYYPPGVLLPIASGTARISASFSTFSDFIDITVGAQPTFTIVQKSPQTNLPSALPLDPNDATKQYVRIAPKSIIDLDVTATLDGLPVDVSAAAVWSFDAPADPSLSNDTTALINSTVGLITAVDASTPLRPLTARATFPTCGQSVAATVVVAPLTGLTIARQFGADPLIVGNSELFVATGQFGDGGPGQDLSAQAVFTSSTPTTAAFSSNLLGIGNLLTGLLAGQIDVSATYNAGTAAVPVNVSTPTLSIATQTGTLTDIAFDTSSGFDTSTTPPTISILAGASTIVPLTVIGSYTLPDMSTITQPINRIVQFTSSNTTIVQVSNATLTRGEIASGGPLANVLPVGTTTATITAAAANPADTANPLTDTITVKTGDPVLPPP